MTARRIKVFVSGALDKNSFSFNNLLLRSPLRYKMMERRFLYLLAELVKKRYDLMGLSVRENWENLIFEISDKELAIIGGDTHTKRTYSIIRSLANRGIIQYSVTKDNKLLVDYYHWIDAFRWDRTSRKYTIRVSPELYDYVVQLTKNFTVLDIKTALLLDSKYTQKFYEILTMYSTLYTGKNRFHDFENNDQDYVFKERVFKMPYSVFRYMFGLAECCDPLTGELLEKEKYPKYADVERFVLSLAQQELYKKYKDGICDIWFDYDIADRGVSRKNATPTSLYFYIYTRQHPKSKDTLQDHPYQAGDELRLFPFEEKCNTKVRPVRQSDWLSMDFNWQRSNLSSILMSYFSGAEYNYYMEAIDNEQTKCSETYSQVLQVIYEKSRQATFKTGTQSYKRKALACYVFQDNLRSKYGWSIPPMSPQYTIKVQKHR